MKKDEIIKFIEHAFDGVSQPKEITLHVAEAYDVYDYTHNEDHRKEDFFGPWQQIPSFHIKNCQIALSYVDKIGMRFYLPAYMVWYLKNFGNHQEINSDNILYSLDNYPGDKVLSDYHKEQFSLFTPEQLKACSLFVKYCAEDTTGFADNEFAKEIYDRYWSQFNK